MDVRRGLTRPEDVAFPLNWGIIGTGNISADWVRALRDVPGARVKGVAARSPLKARDFAAECGVASAHESYRALVEDPEIDIVYVGTVTALHKEHALLAINAGKHVLCEKPLALTAEDAAEMYAAAEAKGVMLQEGMWTRFFPAVEHARRAIEDGKIGQVRMVMADFPDKCYAVQAGPLAFGEASPSAVLSSSSKTGPTGAVVQYGDRGCAMLGFPVWNCEYPEVIEIVGHKGRITLDPWGHHPTRVTIRQTPEFCFAGRADHPPHTSTSQNGVAPDLERAEYPLPQPCGTPSPDWHYSNQRGFFYQAQAVHRCLAAGLRQCPQFTKEESLHVLRVLDQINAAQEA